MPMPFKIATEEQQFKLVNDKENINKFTAGTSKIGNVDLIPNKIVLKFGNPIIGDGWKVSGQYVFETNKKEPITLYEWKWTTSYDKSNPFSPKGFWMLDKPIKFSVGGHSKSNFYDFEQWIKSVVK